MSLINEIKNCIEQCLDNGEENFIIYPYGDVGIRVQEILNKCYGIKERCIIDNNLSKYNEIIHDMSYLENLEIENYVVILSSINEQIYNDLKKQIKDRYPQIRLAEFYRPRKLALNDMVKEKWTTKIGKHSYGPLCCNHRYIDSIGAFCSFAAGTDVVPNHPMGYITTSPMLYAGQVEEWEEDEYQKYENAEWFISGIKPHKCFEKRKRIKIGNDVWLGRNVVITNGANVGNGVIAGAGAIITKDVPDYAVVGGIPAKIIRYRYSKEQIDALNKIQWWNWSDDEIRERYDDFYLPIEEFIEKYK